MAALIFGSSTSSVSRPRYADASSSSVPPGPSDSPDPGPGVNLPDVDGTSPLIPLVPDPAPDATRPYPLTVSFQNTGNGRFLGFMNTTVCRIRRETDAHLPSLSLAELVPTLWRINSPRCAKEPGWVCRRGFDYRDRRSASCDGGLDSGHPNSSRTFFVALVSKKSHVQGYYGVQDNLDDGDHPFHLHGHRPWMCVLFVSHLHRTLMMTTTAWPQVPDGISVRR